MLHHPQTEEEMITEGAEFKVGGVYYKHINGHLYCAKSNYTQWYPAHNKSKLDYTDLTGFVDLKPKCRRGRYYER